MLTADYSAEYGGASGAQVRIVTKSGTTNFHGTAYEYLRNSAMNANTWSRNLNPQPGFLLPLFTTILDFPLAAPSGPQRCPS